DPREEEDKGFHARGPQERSAEEERGQKDGEKRRQKGRQKGCQEARQKSGEESGEKDREKSRPKDREEDREESREKDRRQKGRREKDGEAREGGRQKDGSGREEEGGQGRPQVREGRGDHGAASQARYLADVQVGTARAGRREGSQGPAGEDRRRGRREAHPQAPEQGRTEVLREPAQREEGNPAA